MRFPLAVLALLCGLSAATAAPPPAPALAEPVHAVEFPYYLYPRTLWDRELVWLKTIGVRNVAFSIPWNWHQLAPDNFDFTGRTSPRRDLSGLIRTLRRLGLRAWIRPLAPVPGWANNGWPPAADPQAQKVWIKQLETLLATQTASHGGPIAWVEGRALPIDADPAPAAAVIPLEDPAALALSREAILAGRSVIWTNVEDAVYPAGWEATPGNLLRHGGVGLSGREQPSTRALRRDAALLRNWSALIAGLRPVAMPKPASGKFPAGVTAGELLSQQVSAVSIVNRGKNPFRDDLRVTDPATRRALIIPGVTVPAGESLWLPLNVTLGPDGLCRECTAFAGAERILYATAELLSIEYENGILAMEFAAPEPGVVVLQLAREPIGPFIAAGKPTAFDYDEKTLRARLNIPAGSGADRRVRIGIAIQEPDTSAFFNDAHRLTIGQTNTLSTTFSSPDLAARSRLRLPEGFTATPNSRSPNEIEYQVAVPADSLHGDWVPFALEADGIALGRARVQLLRSVSIRLADAIELHYGPDTALAADPPTASIEPKAGTNLEVIVRNNSPQIQTYRLEAAGEGLDFFPPNTEVSIAALSERRVAFRVFAHDSAEGLLDWRLKVTGGATADLPMRALLVPRNRTVVWSADLDGDGSPEWILESQRARAVFSTQDGGRWLEFSAKGANLNFLPEGGAFAAHETAQVHVSENGLEFAGKNWKRTVRLNGAALTVEQNTPLPADRIAPGKREGVTFTIARPSPSQATYQFE